MGFQGTYNPARVVTTWGPVLFRGFADGVFITAERNNPSSILTVGSTGDGARSISNDRSGIVTIVLLQTSVINAQLSALRKADEALGSSVFPFLLKDLSGLDAVKAGAMWIQTPSAMARGREVGDGNTEWIFETDNLDIIVGGIPSVP